MLTLAKFFFKEYKCLLLSGSSAGSLKTAWTNAESKKKPLRGAKNRVKDGARTLDPQNHNLML